MPDYCADSRSAARHHILTFKGSRQRSRAVAGLRCRLGSLLDVYTLSGVCLVSFAVCLGTSFVECRGRAVPGTARCVEPWSKTDL